MCYHEILFIKINKRIQLTRVPKLNKIRSSENKSNKRRFKKTAWRGKMLGAQSRLSSDLHKFTMMYMNACVHVSTCTHKYIKMRKKCKTYIETCKKDFQREINGPSVTGVMYHVYRLNSQNIKKSIVHNQIQCSSNQKPAECVYTYKPILKLIRKHKEFRRVKMCGKIIELDFPN